MVATTALLLSDKGKMCRVLLSVVIPIPSSLCLLLRLAQMNAFLFGMVRFLRLSAITADMRRPLLPLLATVLALCDRPSFLRYKNKLSIW
jgi:hypothetical protein